MADLPALGLRDNILHLFGQTNELRRRLYQRHPLRGQADMASVADEQFRSQFGFQLADQAAQRRLGHMQAQGRSSKVELLGHGQKGCRLVYFHPDIVVPAKVNSRRQAAVLRLSKRLTPPGTSRRPGVRHGPWDGRA